MHLAHHPLFVALSVLTAWLGAWTALDLFRRVQAHSGVARRAWVVAAGLALGLSIWSMHFIAMLGFDPGSDVRYELDLTIYSLLLAIVATTVAFLSAGPNLQRQFGSGLLMGAGIFGMHYLGMAAVVTAAAISHDPIFVALAFIIAVTASAGALRVAARETTISQRVLASAVLGFAIVGMHYTGMLGVRITADAHSPAQAMGIEPFVLAVCVAAGTLFILLLALIAAMSDRRFEAIAVREAVRSEKQLRAILDNLPIGVFVAASPSGDIRFANAEAEALLGHQLGGAAPWAHEGSHGAVDRTGQRLPAEGHVLHQAMQERRRIGPLIRSYRRPDGSVRQFEVTAAPIPARENQGLMSVVAVQDVTAKLVAEEEAREAEALRQTERNLQQMNELLEQRVMNALAEKAEAEAALMHAQRLESLGRLTGGVAHDFNNLLTVVIGSLDIILRDADNAARRARLGEAALAAARTGQQLTAQLLEFALRQPLQPQTLDLNQLIHECEPLLRRAAGESVSLTLALCDEKAIARIDRTQFEASLLNLVVNAVDASPRGGEVAIETQLVSAFGTSSVARSIHVSVADRGQGMPPEVLAHIFEPFFTTKAPGKGTGLGLSQVYGFVKQSGGEVEVQSAPGSGTRITIVLPVHEANTETTVQRSSATTAVARRLRVLLTEDDASVAAITQAMLEELGHSVMYVADAEAALAALKSNNNVDVLLTDVMMPGGMNGVELAREAVKARPDLRVLLCSGYAGELLDRATERSPWPLLRKPYVQAQLAVALTELTQEPMSESPGALAAQ